MSQKLWVVQDATISRNLINYYSFSDVYTSFFCTYYLLLFNTFKIKSSFYTMMQLSTNNSNLAIPQTQGTYLCDKYVHIVYEKYLVYFHFNRTFTCITTLQHSLVVKLYYSQNRYIKQYQKMALHMDKFQCRYVTNIYTLPTQVLTFMFK